VNIIASLSAEKTRGELISRLKSGKPSCLIVPEQFLFETERGMYRALGGSGITAVDITGFAKLSAEIVKRHGKPKLYADDIIKQAEMYKAVSRLKSAFVYYKGGGARFSAKMLELTEDFKSSAVTPRRLREAAALMNPGDALTRKTTDIAAIYASYCEGLEADFADRSDDLEKARALVAEHDLFAGTDVYVYEFDGFNKSQLNLLKAIAESADNLNIFVRTDAKISEKREFFAMNALVSRLERELGAVEFCRLEGEAHAPEVEYWAAGDVYEESEFVAASIRELITKRGYSCSEIAVLACDPNSLPTLADALEQYEVSFFADIPEPIIKKPLTRFIPAALEAVGLDTDKLIAYIRSGWVRMGKRRLSKRHMDLLEKYARKWNLTKKEWARKFPESNADLNRIEPLREKIVADLNKLRAVDSASGDEITAALYAYLIESMSLQRGVIGLCRLKGGGISEEYRQLWDLTVDVFESLYAALKDFPVSLGEYADLLREIFAKVNIARPPRVIDAVTVGDPERSRISGARAVFVIGANHGSFPKSAALPLENEITGRESETLAEYGIELNLRREERYNYERFIVNKAFALPSEKLYVCAPLKDAAFAELRLSPVFDNVKVNAVSKKPLSFWASTAQSARRLAAELSEKPRKAALLKAALREDFAEFPKSDCRHRLTEETAAKLFDFTFFSPTRLETLAGCRFRHFCEYGLRLDIPKAMNDDQPTSSERGNIIHYCLDKIMRIDCAAFKNADDRELDALTEKYIDEYRNALLPHDYAKSRRQEHILRGYKPGIVRMLRHMRGDFAHSGFVPTHFEHRVSYPFGGITLTGKIDRIDVLDDGARKYARVVDYKSGIKEPDFPAVYYGLDAQMPLYLFAVGELGYSPAAAFYMPSDGAKSGDALDSEPGLTLNRETARKNWLSAHMPGGFVIADGGAAEADFAEQEKRYRKESGATARKMFFKAKKLTPEAFGRLKAHCADLIAEQVGGIRRGVADAVPLASANRSACDYCAYSLACGNRGEKVTVDKSAIERLL